MTRATTTKLYRTFAKGLITEAGFLTYPEDASSDELNTVIHRKGNRSRRFGIDYEPNNSIVTLDPFDQNTVTSEFFWKAVADDADLNFICIKYGEFIDFYNEAYTPLPMGRNPYRLPLMGYKTATASAEQVRNTPVQMVSGKGYLFIAQEYLDPIIVSYDPATNTFTPTRIIIQMRDFDGVDDGLANDQEPTTLSKEHSYNLRNQGWVIPGSPVYSTDPNSNLPPPPTGTTDTQTYYNPYTGGPVPYKRASDKEVEQ